MLFISLIASLSKVSQGFEIPCNASNSTMKIVQFCPLDEQTYIESAKKKNCTAILNNCKSFEYHCLSNRQRTALIEVCAPSLYIIGNVCGTYHEGFNSIRSTEKPCPNCPFSYNSTAQFRYPVCYELLTSSTATQNTAPQELSSSPPETKDTFSPDILIENEKNFTKNGQQPGMTINTQSQWKWEYILIAALGLAFLGTVIFIIVERRRKKGNSKSKTDIEANIHLLSNEDEKETQRTGQRSMAISSPGCIEMFDKDQTPNTPVSMDNSVSSQTLLNEQLPSSLMSSNQPTAEAYESETSKTDIQANISSDIISAGPAFSKEIKVETQQPGQRSMTTSFSCGTGMSDKDQILPQNAPDYIDKSETSFEERQTTSLMLSEQLTAEPDDSETSNLKADVQANISTDIKPAAPSFSDEIKRETQRKGQRSIASSSPDCTEMSDKDLTPKTSDCKDNTVLSQPSSYEQQPSSLMSSEQSTAQPHQSDGSMLSMKMSMDDHPEDQERSEKEQALPLNVSDCMDNPSCKDQPQPATCSGQPTGETIGSIQSRSLSAVSPLEAGTDKEATPKAVDNFENQPLAKDSISTQETSATEDPDKNQQSEASMVRKPPDKRSIPVEDNTNQNPVNMDSKKSQIAINVFGNSTDNANFSIFIDRTHLDIPLSATISRENINQHPNRKKDPKAIKNNCTAELEIRGSGTTPIFNDDADQEQSFFYNQEDIENVDINFLRNENRVLKEEISQLKDLRERVKRIERREENMAERERVMAEREKMLRDREKTWQAKYTKENK